MARLKQLTVATATEEDAAALAALHAAVAEDLTARYGPGPWSTKTTERGILFAMRHSRVYAVREGTTLVATWHLATKKPWAIDRAYFTPCARAIYLLGMAVAPPRQRLGIGRKCLDEAIRIAAEWPADAVRLDAFDANAGAGPFYTRCGWTEVGRASYRNTPLIYFERLLTH